MFTRNIRTWFTNLKTLWKLILGFAAVALIMVTVGIIGLLGLQTVRDQLNIVYQNATLSLAGIAELSSTLGLYHHDLLSSGRFIKQIDFEEAVKNLDQYKHATLAPLNDLDARLGAELSAPATAQGQRSELDALRAALATYFESAEGAVSALNESFSPELTGEQQDMMRELGHLALSVEVADKYATATKQVETVVTRIATIASTLNDEGQEVASSRTQWVLIGALLAVALAGAIGYWLAQFFARGVGHIAHVAEQAAAGNLQARAKIQSDDELGHMAASFNKMLDRITGLVQTEDERNKMQKRLTGFLVMVNEVGKGDLTMRGEVTADMFGNLADAFNLMLDRFTNLLNHVRDAASGVNQSASALRDTAGQMADTARHQAEESVKTLAAVEGLSISMRGVAETAGDSSESARQVLTATERGTGAVQETMNDMQTIRAAVQRMSKQIKGLGDRSLEISQIVSTIKDIASQTNLLALNAAIEAAGAGEAGARFAVVADQVRRLAENSTQATHEIADLVKVIQAETQEAVIAMEQETQAVQAGSASAMRTGEVFGEISKIAERSAELAHAIANSSTDQTASTERMGQSIKEFTSGAVATQKATDATRQTIEEMAALAEGLTSSVAQFKVV